MIDLMMHRFTFMQVFSKGSVLDIGCADSAQWRFPIPQETITNPPNITNITLVDCDEWRNTMGLKFLRAFAENIPLPDKSVDTCIYGDILEHVKDVDIVLTEGKRLTRDRIIISVPNEWKWEQNNPNIKTFETREKHISNGINMRELSDTCTINHPSHMCIDAINDVDMPHIHHARFFTEETFKNMIERNFEKENWEYYLFEIKYSIFNFVNMACVVWRKNKKDNIDYSLLKNRLDVLIK